MDKFLEKTGSLNKFLQAVAPWIEERYIVGNIPANNTSSTSASSSSPPPSPPSISKDHIFSSVTAKSFIASSGLVHLQSELQTAPTIFSTCELTEVESSLSTSNVILPEITVSDYVSETSNVVSLRNGSDTVAKEVIANSSGINDLKAIVHPSEAASRKRENGVAAEVLTEADADASNGLTRIYVVCSNDCSENGVAVSTVCSTGSFYDDMVQITESFYPNQSDVII